MSDIQSNSDADAISAPVSVKQENSAPLTALQPAEPQETELANDYGDLLVEDLTPWEANCKPRVVRQDDGVVHIPAKALNVELTCPVCLGLIQKPMAVMECMHRFCDDCISKSIRVGKKECPSCRVKCASRRSLRPDPIFASLIATVYPDREEFEARTALPLVNLQHLTMTAVKPPPPRAPARPQPRRKRRASSSEDSGGYESETASEEDQEMTYVQYTPAVRRDPSRPRPPKKPTPARKLEPVSYAKRITVNREVDLVLLAHPQETRLPGLDKPFLRTSSAVTVTHLCKYLGQKLNHPPSAFVLSVDTAVLDADDLTLADVVSLYWADSDEQLVVHYRLRGE